MSETKTLQVQLHDGTVKWCSIQLLPEKHLYSGLNLNFSGLDLDKQEFSAGDTFANLCELRLELEKIGAQALCAGARIDVWPSGMSRGMGSGARAYITRRTGPSSQEDNINIFDYAPPELVGSVVQQTEFHKVWRESMRKRSQGNL